jgi:hypothetical protein
VSVGDPIDTPGDRWRSFQPNEGAFIHRIGTMLDKPGDHLGADAKKRIDRIILDLKFPR